MWCRRPGIVRHFFTWWIFGFCCGRIFWRVYRSLAGSPIRASRMAGYPGGQSFVSGCLAYCCLVYYRLGLVFPDCWTADPSRPCCVPRGLNGGMACRKVESVQHQCSTIAVIMSIEVRHDYTPHDEISGQWLNRRPGQGTIELCASRYSKQTEDSQEFKEDV